MQPYRDIAVLAGTQVLCFLFLAQFEPRFVVIHLYQSVLYLAILILLYYREDRWAYMIAMLASAGWLVLAYVSPLLSMAVRQLVAFRGSDTTQIAVNLLALVTAVLAVSMIALCARHWWKEYVGLGKTLNTFLISFGIVAVYYGIFLHWFWAMIPDAMTNTGHGSLGRNQYRQFLDRNRGGPRLAHTHRRSWRAGQRFFVRVCKNPRGVGPVTAGLPATSLR